MAARHAVCERSRMSLASADGAESTYSPNAERTVLRPRARARHARANGVMVVLLTAAIVCIVGGLLRLRRMSAPHRAPLPPPEVAEVSFPVSPPPMLLALPPPVVAVAPPPAATPAPPQPAEPPQPAAKKKRRAHEKGTHRALERLQRAQLARSQTGS